MGPTRSRRVTGRIAVHPRGFGFLNVDDQAEEVRSAFIAPPDLNAFLAGDRVSAEIGSSDGARRQATDLKLMQPRGQVVGKVVRRAGAQWLQLDKDVANAQWPLDGEGLAEGDMVIATRGEGRLAFARKLGPDDDITLERIIARHGVLTSFDADALADAARAHARPHTLGSRRDLRDVPTVTVDAPTTRDIDDAVSVLPAGSDGAMRLLVSIADVSEFIDAGTPLDRAARDRATSTYLAGRVLHMLPEKLSADSLSLLPGTDRSCLTIEMRIDAEGNIASVDVYESLIRSWARLNYTEVAAWLDHGEWSEAMQPVREAMPWFRTASARLGVARMRRGGVLIERDEARITFDPETRTAVGIEAVRSNSAHVMIERFMVAANEGIANWLADRGVPGPFRVHEPPAASTLPDLNAMAHNFGFEAAFGRTLTPLALAAFDVQISGSETEPAIRSALRRTLGPARYTVHAAPHFGLGAPLYLHFTSPIRRYADLLVHRAVKQYLRGRRDFCHDDEELEKQCAHINARAFESSKAEQDRRRVLEAQLMATRTTETFAARIVKVKPFGLIAQIDLMLVEGLIPTENLPGGQWEIDARETCLTGPGGRYTIGSPVTVRVASTDAELGRIELSLALTHATT